jgi:hypothetical protein
VVTKKMAFNIEDVADVLQVSFTATFLNKK